MDVLFFLKERTKFLRRFYEESASGFLETQRKIREGEPPFDEAPPGFNPEDGEPPFLEEWQRAEDSIDFLGQAAVSYLATSLCLYLDEFRNDLPRWVPDPGFDSDKERSKGKLAAYVDWFNGMKVDLGESGCDMAIIEQVILTRNSVQHPRSIGLTMIQPGKKQKNKYPRPFFVHDLEERLLEQSIQQGHDFQGFSWLMQVNRGKLFIAIEEVDKLCAWIDSRFFRRHADGTLA